jgi:hypothetical protein
VEMRLGVEAMPPAPTAVAPERTFRAVHVAGTNASAPTAKRPARTTLSATTTFGRYVSRPTHRRAPDHAEMSTTRCPTLRGVAPRAPLRAARRRPTAARRKRARALERARPRRSSPGIRLAQRQPVAAYLRQLASSRPRASLREFGSSRAIRLGSSPGRPTKIAQ